MRSSLKLNLNNGASLAAIAASLLFVSLPASAQTAPAQSQTIETITVTGIRASLESAMEAKRNAGQVIDAISAEDIGKFPDKDMGEALQRVTGVQINRSSGGEGSTVTIRGSDPTMTRVEIDGTGALSVTVGSTDRAIDFRDLPVEFVQRIEVIKSPTADMTEGGVGGTVRIITRHPFDSTDSYIAGSAQDVNSNLSRTDDPKLALIASKLFFNDTVGVLLSGTYEEEHLYDGQALTTGWLQQAKTFSAQGLPANACGSFFGGTGGGCGAGYTNSAGALVGDWYPQIPRYFNNRRNTLRKGLNSSVEFRPNDDFKFFWDMTYAVADERVDNQALQLNDNGGVFDYADTTVGPDHTVSQIEETSNGSQNVTTGCTSAAHPNTTPGCLPLDLTFRDILGYLTRAQLTVSVGASYNLTSEVTLDGRFDFARAKVDNEETDATGIQYGTPESIVTYAGPQYAPNISLPGTDLLHGSGINNLDAFYVPVTNTSRETSETFNAQYKPGWADWLTLKAGFLRHDYTVIETSFGKHATLTCRGSASSGSTVVVPVSCPTITNIVATTAGTNPIPFYSTGNLGFNNEARTWLDLNQKTIAAVIAATGSNVYDLSTLNPNANTNGTFETYLANWGVNEGTTDFYGEAGFDFPDFYFPVSGNLGWREVNTHSESTGFTQLTCTSPCQTTFPRASIAGSYEQGLPSANVKVDLIPDELIARFAAGRVMARPAPSQIAINRKLDIVGLTGSQGNPGLLPFVSTDYDAGLEWYFSKVNYVSLGLFQKNISRFILNTTSPLDVNGVTYSITRPVNGTTPVKVNGLEAAFQYAFDWLPKPFDGLGVLANLTLQKDSGFNQLSLIDGTHEPFPGLSQMADNYSVYYENEDVSARLSYVWRSKWLINATGRGNLPEYNASYGEVDMSVSYNITPEWSVFADGINLTDSQLVQYNAPVRPIQYDTFGTRLYFGIRAKY